jgi:hypothetical protein
MRGQMALKSETTLSDPIFFFFLLFKNYSIKIRLQLYYTVCFVYLDYCSEIFLVFFD